MFFFKELKIIISHFFYYYFINYRLLVTKKSYLSKDNLNFFHPQKLNIV